jgi:hypothetical protein
LLCTLVEIFLSNIAQNCLITELLNREDAKDAKEE